MIPSISPPTDNLYKFVALFGLGLFILSIVNQSKHRSDLIKSKIEVERMQQRIFDTIQVYQSPNLSTQQKLQDDIAHYNHVQNMFSQLDELEDFIMKSPHIPLRAKNLIVTEIDIIEIRSEVIERQEQFNWLLMISSIGLILVGFTLWYFLDQKWRDKEIKLDKK